MIGYFIHECSALQHFREQFLPKYCVRRSVISALGHKGTPGTSRFVRCSIVSLVDFHRSIVSARGHKGTAAAFHNDIISNVPLFPQCNLSFRCVRGDLSPFHYVRREFKRFVISDLFCIGIIPTSAGDPYI